MNPSRRVHSFGSYFGPVAAVSPRGRRSATIAAILLAVLMAACQDATAPLVPPDGAQLAKQPSSGVWTVTSLGDPGAGSCTAAYCTLRQAIAAAQPGDKIVFKSNLSGTIELAEGELEIAKSLTLDGEGRITVNGQGASRVVRIGGGPTVVIAGLTIIGGSVEQDGGGILTDGFLTLSRVTLSGNRATGAVLGGGGIYNSGHLTILNSTITDNFAINGGGISSFGTGLIIVGGTISGNRAQVWGGGLYGNRVTLRSSTVTANTATEGGGGLYLFPVASVSNTIVAGNSADVDDECKVTVNFDSHGYNLTTMNGGCEFNASSDIVLFPAQIFTDVLSPALANNGGPTKTHALVERGRAVDAGYCPGQTADQRGLPRPYDDSRMANAADGCDIGAFEWQPAATTGPGKGPRK